ncbi:RcpC/CpaB family pilus assembly protein [Streptomyces sp. NBRC 110028]|uniref:RcpC/CpaB family pilus assembly protein n=1 Tax=Streptomyces sp. NBRC 110028 TaxID=1621260 RepID=UPI00099EDE4F|nr:RcpC/CpaB family pilus assembly protein [Streptomyces sp. NBRC 110028]
MSHLFSPSPASSFPTPSPASPSPASSSPTSPLRAPSPPSRATPPARAVPPFGPVRVARDGGYRLRRSVRRRRRSMAAGLALTAAALAAAASSGQGSARPEPSPATAAGSRYEPSRPATVSAPVRIADTAAVRLLHPGDRVDVLAAPASGAVRHHGSGAPARVVARGVRVASVPGLRGGDPPAAEVDEPDAGALVVLTVPRPAAAALAGAEATSRLAVALCRS